MEGLDKDDTFRNDLLREFRARWKSSPASGSGLDPGKVEKLERFADAALEAFKISYLDPTRYSVEEDWSKAKAIHNQWKQDGKLAGKPLGVKSDLPRLKLIDVLNAAWYSRFKEVADTPRIEVAARKYCDRILESQQAAGASGNQQPAARTFSGVES